MVRLFLFSLCLSHLVFGFPQEFRLPKLKDDGVHWALLVAGSSEWLNYRHQADVCHAYQVLKNHGLPDERIIVMMVDDIAENEQNPVLGTIINQPDGPDVYQGVPKDYTGLDGVTPEIFLNVLQGAKDKLNGMGSGKVINSGPNDHIFVNFVDHGGPDLIAFPNEFLYGEDLMKVLKEMNNEKKFAKLVFYLESCESGSMFETLLPKDINILALTASSSTQSSYACYFDMKRKTYLGDVFSEMWMQDSDKENLNTETINKQFKITRRKTNTSQVMEFGDKSILQMTVAEFQGKQQSNRYIFPAPDPTLDAVKSEDVDMEILKKLWMLSEDDQEKSKLMKQLTELSLKRSKVDSLVKEIISRTVNHDHSIVTSILEDKVDLYNHDCYKETVEYLKDTCADLDLHNFQYSLRRLYTFVNLCERNKYSFATIKSAIDKTCTKLYF